MQTKTGLGFLIGAMLAHALGRPNGAGGRRSIQGVEPLILPPASSPAIAAGALALGALAIGALAIGALAIGRLEMRQGRIRKLQIDDLTVGRLRVVETAHADAPDSDDAA